MSSVRTPSGSGGWLDSDAPAMTLDPNAIVRLHRSSGLRCWSCRCDLDRPFDTTPRHIAHRLSIAACFGRLLDTDFVAATGVPIYAPGTPVDREARPLGTLVRGTWLVGLGQAVTAASAAVLAEALTDFISGRRPRFAPRFDARFSLAATRDWPAPELAVTRALELGQSERENLAGPMLAFVQRGAFVIGGQLA